MTLPTFVGQRREDREVWNGRWVGSSNVVQRTKDDAGRARRAYDMRGRVE